MLVAEHGGVGVVVDQDEGVAERQRHRDGAAEDGLGGRVQARRPGVPGAQGAPAQSNARACCATVIGEPARHAFPRQQSLLNRSLRIGVFLNSASRSRRGARVFRRRRGGGDPDEQVPQLRLLGGSSTSNAAASVSRMAFTSRRTFSHRRSVSTTVLMRRSLGCGRRSAMPCLLEPVDDRGDVGGVAVERRARSRIGSGSSQGELHRHLQHPGRQARPRCRRSTICR